MFYNNFSSLLQLNITKKNIEKTKNRSTSKLPRIHSLKFTQNIQNLSNSSIYTLLMLELALDLSLIDALHHREDRKDSWLRGNGRSGIFGMSISPSKILRASEMVGLRATIT